MNQILVTEKLYITPELRRKRKIYKMGFFLSVFLVTLLFSFYIYAEYDRSRSEEVSQEILSEIKINKKTDKNKVDNTTKKTKDNVIVVALDDNTENESVQIKQTQASTVEYTTSNGTSYKIEAVVSIPSLDINYPVISDTSEELLKISVNKYWGPAPNQVGNYCIVGHNYKSKKMFGRLEEISNDDIIEITDVNDNTVKYAVYDRYVVEPDDVDCTSQLTNGKKEVTLITCTNYGKQRLVVKAREVK